MDDAALNDYNVQASVDNFLEQARTAANMTAGCEGMGSGDARCDVMFMMGTDFSYENAVTWFRNIDKIIKYVNLGTASHGVHAQYGTPDDYSSSKISTTPLPPRVDDMFPYCDSPHACWSG
jgi:alpha-mannosidase